MTTSKTDYQSLSNELQNILSDLQAGELSIDEALKRFERGQAIVKDLQNYLDQAENKIKKFTAS
jgi:exodeoxyribonuclease VII small subunit